MTGWMVLSGLLALLLSTANAAEPAAERAARLQSGIGADRGRIILIQPDRDAGVWALTRNGKLFYCRRQGEGDQEHIQCLGKEGKIDGDY